MTSHTYSPTPSSPYPTPTAPKPQDVHFFPRVTPSPSCCAPSEVVIQLSTDLLVPDYTLYYQDTPLSRFDPSYVALSDGSLTTSAFRQDSTQANTELLLLGLFATIFARNVFLSGDYIRRTKVRRKVLFWTLFVSQLLAISAIVPLTAAFFNHRINCNSVALAASISEAISTALLMTGILGYKAYKCLDSSLFVLLMLVLLCLSTSSLAVVNIVETRGTRRISGSCLSTGNSQITRVYIILQFVQAFFIFCCFLYAAWKSRNSPVARGRISIQLSMDDVQEHNPKNSYEKYCRGWWDCIAGTGIHVKKNCSDTTEFRTTSFAGQFPQVQSQPSMARIFESAGERAESNRSSSQPSHGRYSPAPSSFSRFSRYMPRMELFRKVMKDELYYTATITACCVVVGVLSVIGINFRNGLSVGAWMSLNWAVTSILAIHSTGRVVRRHERDFLLQDAAVWQGRRWENGRSRPAPVGPNRWNNSSISSQSMRRRAGGEADDLDNPFDDMRGLTQSCVSWTSRFSSASDPPLSPSINSIMRPLSSHYPVYLPGPSPTAQFPTSGRTTPLVPLDSTDGTLLQRPNFDLSSSWIQSRSRLSVTSNDEKM